MEKVKNSYKWWQTGIIYQIYPKSFKDTDGSGTGDLKGIIEKLDYLNDGTPNSLGIDAIWLSPVFESPQVDAGYDVSDYRKIDPSFGTMEDFKKLLSEAHNRNIKILLDFVPNHTSDQHPWFLESKSSKDNPKRDWYVWRDAKEDGSLPNNWGSIFGGTAWEYDETTNQYYFHQFCKEQPDLNLFNPEPRNALFDDMRFWLDMGVDGFRLDALNHIGKDPNWPDQPLKDPSLLSKGEHSIYDKQEHIYDNDYEWAHKKVYCGMRKVLDEYEDKVSVAEAYVGIGNEFDEHGLSKFLRYYGTKEEPEFHLPFNFRLMGVPWKASVIRSLVDPYDKAVKACGWPNYVLGNHDRSRIGTHVGEEQKKNVALVLLTLRGTPTLYNGDELGLEDVEIPVEKMKDPQAITYGPHRSRDPCRTPLPWNASPNAGFSPEKSETWLPVNDDFLMRNVAALGEDENSILVYYRKLIWLRKKSPALLVGDYRSLDLSKEVKLSQDQIENAKQKILKEYEDESMAKSLIEKIPKTVKVENVYGFVRSLDEEKFVILINFTGKEQTVSNPEIKGELVLASVERDALDGTTADGDYTLMPNEGAIIKVTN